MIVFQSENVLVEWNERENILHKTFAREINGQELQTAYMVSLEHLQQKGTSRWLTDHRDLPPIDVSDRQWMLNDWLPRALAAGWKYWAVIERQGFLGGHSLRHAIPFYRRKGLELRVFHSPDVALDWLRTV